MKNKILSSLDIGDSLVVAKSDWRDKKVINPKTGNRVKVKSLPPELQDKYRPKENNKGESKFFSDKRKNIEDVKKAVEKKQKNKPKPKKTKELKEALESKKFKENKKAVLEKISKITDPEVKERALVVVDFVEKHPEKIADAISNGMPLVEFSISDVNENKNALKEVFEKGVPVSEENSKDEPFSDEEEFPEFNLTEFDSEKEVSWTTGSIISNLLSGMLDSFFEYDENLEIQKNINTRNRNVNDALNIMKDKR